MSSSSSSSSNGALQRRERRQSNDVSENGQNVELPQIAEKVVVQVDLLPEVPEGEHVFMEWNDVNCTVPAPIVAPRETLGLTKYFKRIIKSPDQAETKPAREKQILHSIGGYARAGHLTALMGPSGSGKTTLLSILGDRSRKPLTPTGTVTYNGYPVNKSVKRLLGFVSQDELMYPNLTVYETLFYAALLKLPQTMSRTEKLGRVEAVISALGLNKCRDTVIGGMFRPGISGGEKKRVCIGHEMLVNPSVLILDEPTSGLDSSGAMRMISTLVTLAEGSRVVLLSIHQPSSRMFGKFSNLMLLSEGRVMYHGYSNQAAKWFDQQGFPVPSELHIADYILDLANGDVTSKHMDGESVRAQLTEKMASYLKTNIFGFEATGSAAAGTSSGSPLVKDTSKLALLDTTQKAEKWGATFFQQVSILLSRASKNRRFDTMSYQILFQTFGASLFTTLMWWQTGDGNTLLSATDVSAAVFFVLLHVQYEVMFKGIMTFPLVIGHMIKERTSGMYRLSAFFISETLCDLPLDYTVPLLFIIATYWGVHLRQSLSSFLSTVCVLILSGLNVQTIGLLIGTTVMNPKTAASIGTVLMLVLVLATGFFVREVPSWMGWLKYIAAPYWAYRLILQIQFSDRIYVDCGGVSELQLPLENCTRIENLGDELNLPVDVNGPKWPSILALFAMLIVFRVVIYCILKAATSS